MRPRIDAGTGLSIALENIGFGFLTIATSLSLRFLGGFIMVLGVLPAILAEAAAVRERDRLDTLQWKQRQLSGERGVEQMDAADERRAAQDRRGARS